jgi:hypothetical protein
MDMHAITEELLEIVFSMLSNLGLYNEDTSWLEVGSESTVGAVS